MAKEHKCRKCGLNYKGFSNSCPYCHKTTKYGIFNTIMCVIGYITTILFVIGLVYYEILKMTILSFAFMPLIITVLVIAAFVGLIILLLK